MILRKLVLKLPLLTSLNRKKNMELTVNLGPRTYPIILDENCGTRFPAHIKTRFPKAKIGLVTNETIAALYENQIAAWKKELDLVVHVMPDGERYKNLDTWGRIFDTFLPARFERNSVLVAFGGGVVGDMAGFAAATMLRGIPCIQVPTTLLAMVDSSVGGKTGLDHAAGKNLIGAFHQPGLVWIDVAFLATLPAREQSAGYAELFKYAFIGGKKMFDFVYKNHEKLMDGDRSTLLEGIKRSIAIKANVVEQDEFETKGTRAMLNFGHTFAHALEKHFGFEALHHGEAVWWGMACSCRLGKLLGSIPAYAHSLYDEMVMKMPRPALPSVPRIDDLYNAMFFDKKVKDGKLRFVVPAEPGSSVLNPSVDPDRVKAVLEIVFKRG
jgi:3-dehydroquinate synthase